MSEVDQTKTALLTVGSTHFDDLVKAALEPVALEALRQRGVSRFIVQYGEGNIRQILRYVALEPEGGFPTVSGGVSCTIKTGEAVIVEMYPFLEDIDGRMGQADLVICHAGVLTAYHSSCAMQADLQLCYAARRRIHFGRTTRTSFIASSSKDTVQAAHHRP